MPFKTLKEFPVNHILTLTIYTGSAYSAQSQNSLFLQTHRGLPGTKAAAALVQECSPANPHHDVVGSHLKQAGFQDGSRTGTYRALGGSTQGIGSGTACHPAVSTRQ